MAVMATLAGRILDAIRYAPLDDDVLARRLGVGNRQAVNQAARRLEAQGRLRRFTGPDGKIVNALPDSPVQQTSELTLRRYCPRGVTRAGSPRMWSRKRSAHTSPPGASTWRWRGDVCVGSTSTPGTPTAAATS